MTPHAPDNEGDYNSLARRMSINLQTPNGKTYSHIRLCLNYSYENSLRASFSSFAWHGIGLQSHHFSKFSSSSTLGKSMSQESPPKHLDVVIAIIFRQSKILIAKRRKGDAFADHWEFPGGKQEPSESAVDCLHRELREELDISVNHLEPLEAIPHTYPEFQVCLHPFICQLASGEPKPLTCQQLAWVTPEELRQHQFPAANAQLIEDIIYRCADHTSFTDRAQQP